jgi:hypothetical protein
LTITKIFDIIKKKSQTREKKEKIIMAKLSFTKLNKIKSLPIVEILVDDQKVLVEQYLPLEEKVNLITSVIEQSGNGEEGFFNIVKLEAYYIIEMIRAYTNISFTEKQLEDTTKLYDAIRLNDVWAAVADAIPQSERDYIWNNILALAREITTYNNSVLGVLKAISNDRDALNFDVTEIMDKLNDPEALTLLKSMVEKTGLTN